MLSTVDSPPRNEARASERFDAVIKLPFGRVGVRTEGAYIKEISFLADDVPCIPATHPLAQRAVDQLVAYGADSAMPIDLPLAIEGTEFQRRVWREIACTPRGTTRSYGEIARQLNSAARAVGQACGDNRLPLAIPCHRVVAASGVGGFAHHRGGAYERIKRWLLAHEADDELHLT